MFLSADDLHRLTGRKRFKAQRLALDRLGIRYVAASSGEPLVRAGDLDAAGRPAHRQQPGHRWDRIGSIRQLKPRAA